jgi:hypothetical protein
MNNLRGPFAPEFDLVAKGFAWSERVLEARAGAKRRGSFGLPPRL